MNHTIGRAPRLVRPDPAKPIFQVTGRDSLIVRAGTAFGDHVFAEDTAVLETEDMTFGTDYVVILSHGVVRAFPGLPTGDDALGGFHYAPGGNAPARAGGDDIPAINPCSLWDLGFRPACADPRGMALIESAAKPFWSDIYLTGVNAIADGSSLFGALIANGDDRPFDAGGKRYPRFDYQTAIAVLAACGKTLLSHDEFIAAAHGVKERSSAPRDPNATGLDAAHTSGHGVMQATGNLWIWGHDGDPDHPRASLFGGSWVSGDLAGSRYASVGNWPGDSGGSVGARGRSDHLQRD